MTEILTAYQRFWSQERANIECVMVEVQSEGILGRIEEFCQGGTVECIIFLACMPVLTTRLRETIGPNIPFLIHIHADASYGFIAEDGGELTPFIERDVLLCSSQADADAFRVLYPNARTAVFPVPVELLEHFACQSRRIEQGPEKLSLIYAGRLSPEKNIHILLDAIKLLNEVSPDKFTLDIFSGDSLRPDILGRRVGSSYVENLKDKILDLGLKDQIESHSFVSSQQLSQEIAKRSIFVSPSVAPNENFGMAAALALFVGRKAVLSHWGGHRDLGQRYPDQVGFVAVESTSAGPSIDPRALAEQILCVAARPGPQVDSEPRSKQFDPEPWIRGASNSTGAANIRPSRDFETLRSLGRLKRAKPAAMTDQILKYHPRLARRLWQAYGMGRF